MYLRCTNYDCRGHLPESDKKCWNALDAFQQYFIVKKVDCYDFT